MMLNRGAIALLAGVSAGSLAAPVVDRTSPTPVTNVSREQLENLPTSRSVEDLIRTCPARTIPTVTRPAQGSQGRAPASGPNCVQPSDLNMIKIYKAHNKARGQVGSRPLVWDQHLADQAASYGPELAQYGRPVHSSRVGRETSRENLLQALPGTSADAMVGVWVAEQRYFLNGAFPNVSKTGNWADVGHWTQMVWPTTTNLGCAIHRGGQFDWLICRYSPPGNKDGKMVLAEREKEAPLPPTTGGGILHSSGVPQPQKAAPGPCSPARMAAYDVRIRWGDTPPAQPGSTPKPPPESILDDVGENSPPPESILDDVGDSRAREAPLPPSGKEKALHDKPMAQPRGAPPPESVLDDVGQDSTCKPPPAKPTGVANQPKLQDLSWLAVPDRLDEWVFQVDAGFKAAEKKCDQAALDTLAANLDELEEQTERSAKLITPARAAGEFSTVDADHLDKSVDHTRNFIGESRAKLDKLRQRCASAR